MNSTTTNTSTEATSTPASCESPNEPASLGPSTGPSRFEAKYATAIPTIWAICFAAPEMAPIIAKKITRHRIVTSMITASPSFRLPRLT